jgi:hypothetical protein
MKTRHKVISVVLSVLLMISSLSTAAFADSLSTTETKTLSYKDYNLSVDKESMEDTDPNYSTDKVDVIWEKSNPCVYALIHVKFDEIPNYTNIETNVTVDQRASDKTISDFGSFNEVTYTIALNTDLYSNFGFAGVTANGYILYEGTLTSMSECSGATKLTELKSGESGTLVISLAGDTTFQSFTNEQLDKLIKITANYNGVDTSASSETIEFDENNWTWTVGHYDYAYIYNDGQVNDDSTGGCDENSSEAFRLFLQRYTGSDKDVNIYAYYTMTEDMYNIVKSFVTENSFNNIQSATEYTDSLIELSSTGKTQFGVGKTEDTGKDDYITVAEIVNNCGEDIYYFLKYSVVGTTLIRTQLVETQYNTAIEADSYEELIKESEYVDSSSYSSVQGTFIGNTTIESVTFHKVNDEEVLFDYSEAIPVIIDDQYAFDNEFGNSSPYTENGIAYGVDWFDKESESNWNKTYSKAAVNRFAVSSVYDRTYLSLKSGRTAKGAFAFCTNLKTVNGLPDNIVKCTNMFRNCTSLESVDNIPSECLDMTKMFYGCTSLQTTGQLPENVISMYYSFYDCESLNPDFSYDVPNTVKNMICAFRSCSSMEKTPSIKYDTDITSMMYTFKDCKSLTNLPIVPYSVSDLTGTFRGCVNAVGIVGDAPHILGVNQNNLDSNTTASGLGLNLTDTYRNCVKLGTDESRVVNIVIPDVNLDFFVTDVDNYYNQDLSNIELTDNSVLTTNIITANQISSADELSEKLDEILTELTDDSNSRLSTYLELWKNNINYTNETSGTVTSFERFVQPSFLTSTKNYWYDTGDKATYGYRATLLYSSFYSTKYYSHNVRNKLTIYTRKWIQNNDAKGMMYAAGKGATNLNIITPTTEIAETLELMDDVITGRSLEPEDSNNMHINYLTYETTRSGIEAYDFGSANSSLSTETTKATVDNKKAGTTSFRYLVPINLVNKRTAGDEYFDRIVISTPPTKVEYEVGETFDDTGMVVDAVYVTEWSDNYKQERTVTNVTYTVNKTTAFAESDISDSGKDVTVSRTEKNSDDEDVTKTATQKVTVKAKAGPTVVSKEWIGIEIKQSPDKVSYIEDETFDATGMLVDEVYKITYSNGKVETTREKCEDYTYDLTGALKVTDSQVTVSKTKTIDNKDVTKTATVDITVVAKDKTKKSRELDSIEITRKPDKTSYIEGEKFDKSGMVVTATYKITWEQTDSNTGDTVTSYTYEKLIISNYTYSPTEALKLDDKLVTVSKTDNGITKEATVDIEVYQLGTINISGRLVYSDGSPIANKLIELHSDVQQTRTDSNGYYSFNNVSLGNHKLTVFASDDKTVEGYVDLVVKANQSDNTYDKHDDVVKFTISDKYDNVVDISGTVTKIETTSNDDGDDDEDDEPTVQTDDVVIEAKTAVNTGDNSNLTLAMVIAVISFVGVVIIEAVSIIKDKKKEENEY